jgi:glycosyltransferase involved in cell wall biosynthesis
MKKVCLLTSVHPAFDTRIFHKQARSLAKAGYEVTLIAQHDRDEIVDGVRIVALPKPKNRFYRMLGTWRVFKLARIEKADIYHFHDPELLFVGILLKLLSCGITIYDVHENIKWQILTKPWLHNFMRRPLSLLYQLVERISLPFVDYIIIAEDSYVKNYGKKCNIVSIRNYPILSYSRVRATSKDNHPAVVYVGGITESRGVLELVKSMNIMKSRYENIYLILVGEIYDNVIMQKLQKMRVEFDIVNNTCISGEIAHEKIYDILSESTIGVAILHNEPNYIESLPTKLFEYMASGLPIVASNFPLWKQIVDDIGCGLTVDPLNPIQIAEALEYLIEHPDEANKMGNNGRKAVLEKYNWESESKKLLTVYESLLG